MAPLFGLGQGGNRLLGGGEAGPEAILPLTDKVLGGIGKGIADTMSAGQNVTQNITINSPEPMSPSEVARQFKKC